MSAPSPDYSLRVAEYLTRLGIPADYAAKRNLQLQPEATELVSVGLDDNGRECLLHPAAAEAWHRMKEGAQAHDIVLLPLSGFRGIDRQAEIIRGKLALGEKIADILCTIAAPGYSEHHTGRAIDIGTPGVLPLEEAFATTAAYAWLARHGGRFGFRMSYPRHNRHGFIYEPWHWFWQG